MRLLIWSLVLLVLSLSNEALAEETCTADRKRSCEQECRDGRAVACHLQGEALEASAESFEERDDRTARIVDPKLMQEAQAAYALGCAGEFTWSCYKLAELDRKKRWSWARKGTRVDNRLCRKDKEAWACTRLGLVYKEGKVVARNSNKAMKLFEMACKAGEDPACAHLGVMLIDKKGTPSKRTRGVSLLEDGCRGGLAWACIRLGGDYRSGTLLIKDLDAAERLLRAACKLDHQEGCVLLGVMLDQEQRGGKSKEAFGLFERACKADVQSGCVNLGDLLETGRGASANLARAASLFEAACNRFVGGCVRIGRMYDEGRGVKTDAARARGYFDRGCQNQDDNACFHLGLSLNDSRGGAEQPQEAARYFKAQCNAGRALSCQLLAEMHNEGKGVRKSPALRRQLLRKSCKLGREQACGLIAKP